MKTTQTENGSPDGPLYRIESAVRAYGSGDIAVRAVDGIDLEIGRGEFVVIVGPSGSGKSTMLQLLGALDRPTDGSIEFEGRDLHRASESELAEMRLRTIGFIFQQFNLIPTLSAQENVEAAIAPTGVAGTQRSSVAHARLADVGLADRASHLPSQLSGGEQQRVAIARALANDPDVLLADEPTGNLDSSTGETILDLLYELWREHGLTIVLITHDASVAERAPRVIRLADGRVASDESIAAGLQPQATHEHEPESEVAR